MYSMSKSISDLDTDWSLQELLPTSEEIQKKYDLVAKLERLLNAEWPGKNFTVHAFGSTENMLATHKSDR